MTERTTITKPTAEETRRAERTRSERSYRPNVDIIEGADELLVRADVPGARAEDIDIRFEDGTLAMHVSVAPRQDDGVHYLLREYGVGDFYRTFEVSEAVDANRISAECADGVLTLHLPKADLAKPRKISVAAP